MHELQTYIKFLYFIIILSFLGFAYVEFIFLDYDVLLFLTPDLWLCICCIVVNCFWWLVVSSKDESM